MFLAANGCKYGKKLAQVSIHRSVWHGKKLTVYYVGVLVPCAADIGG